MTDLPAGEISVIGLGASGAAAATWLAKHGYPVYASDSNSRPELHVTAERLAALGAAVDLGRHDMRRVQRSALVVASPGVPPGAAVMSGAAEAGVEVISEIELALRCEPGFEIIAVTGTNGKSTTTQLTAHIMRSAGIGAVAAGNIGIPLIELVDGNHDVAWVVLEVSSFQLHHVRSLDPAAGLMTNLSADHLDRYDTVDEYFDDKRRFFQNASPGSVWILNRDDKAVVSMAAGVPGRKVGWSLNSEADAYYDSKREVLILGGRDLLPRERLQLLGDHNVANALAASLAAREAGVSQAAVARGLESFEGLPHRLQRIAAPDGSTWINDSKATNVASTLVALAAMTRPYVWVAGGSAKGEDFTPLAGALTGCAAVVLLGETAQDIKRVLGGHWNAELVNSIEEAVCAARDKLPPGGVVLFSPACPSYDMFRNFEDRGNRFRKTVESL